MKKNFAFTKLMIAVMVVATLCACEKQPAAVEEPPVEVVEETIVEEPNPIVEEPEVTEPEEVEEPEVVEEPEEVSEYAQVPEELLDENGVYIPVDVTADMLRERFTKIDNYVTENGYQDAYTTVVETEILQANYAFITEEDFNTIVKEYNIELNKMPEQFYYVDYEIAPEEYFFDPYLQYEAKTIYDLAYERQQVWINDGSVATADYHNKEMTLLYNKYSKLLEKGEYDINGDTGKVPFNLNQNGIKLGSKYDKDPLFALYIIEKMNNYSYGNWLDMYDCFGIKF